MDLDTIIFDWNGTLVNDFDPVLMLLTMFLNILVNLG